MASELFAALENLAPAPAPSGDAIAFAELLATAEATPADSLMQLFMPSGSEPSVAEEGESQDIASDPSLPADSQPTSVPASTVAVIAPERFLMQYVSPLRFDASTVESVPPTDGEQLTRANEETPQQKSTSPANATGEETVAVTPVMKSVTRESPPLVEAAPDKEVVEPVVTTSRTSDLPESAIVSLKKSQRPEGVTADEADEPADKAVEPAEIAQLPQHLTTWSAEEVDASRTAEAQSTEPKPIVASSGRPASEIKRPPQPANVLTWARAHSAPILTRRSQPEEQHLVHQVDLTRSTFPELAESNTQEPASAATPRSTVAADGSPPLRFTSVHETPQATAVTGNEAAADDAIKTTVRDAQPQTNEPPAELFEKRRQPGSVSGTPPDDRPAQHLAFSGKIENVGAPHNTTGRVRSASTELPERIDTPQPARLPVEPGEPPRTPVKTLTVSVDQASGPERTDIHFVHRNGTVDMAVRATNPETARILRNDLPELVRSLERQGFQSDLDSSEQDREGRSRRQYERTDDDD